MKKKGYLLLLLVTVAAFWQVFFLQNGIKWDFVDAFLPSRYFFSESVLNNQFPLWNPYLLYGTPIFADLVSVFSPEYWIVANLFGYSNITLQFVFLAYIFLAGVSFNYFLKYFNVDQKLSLALSVAYMLSGVSIGNAQHIAFVYSFAIVPFVLTAYFSFVHQLNKQNFVRLSVSLFLVIFGGYPGVTIILGYFLLSIFVYSFVANHSNKSYLKKLTIYHLFLIITVVLFSLVLIIAYIQGFPFLSRYHGLSLNVAQSQPFTFKSIISFILPMASGTDSQYFGTDPSMTNAYFGIIGLILFFFALTKKIKVKESYLILGFGIVALLASFGNLFFLREFLFNYFPLMNMFKYPAIFRGFAIFSFLAFAGININSFEFGKTDRKFLGAISGLIFLLILVLIFRASQQLDHFVFFQQGLSFSEEISAATRFDNIVLQGITQLIILCGFIIILWKIKDIRNFSTAILFLFLADGIVSTQLCIYNTVISQANPIKFYHYLKSSPKGFPIPGLNPIGENSDRNAHSDFTWINDNVFPKKVTFDGSVSFTLDGYAYLSDKHPDLLEAIKKEPVVYFSDDIRKDSSVKDFSPKTVFLSAKNYSKIGQKELKSDLSDKLSISNFSPTKIEIETTTKFSQLLVYQQNYFTNWNAFIDGEPHELLKSNFTHMAVLVPPGKHLIVFEFRDTPIKLFFCFTYLIFFGLLVLLIYFVVNHHPERKKRVIVLLLLGVLIFIVGSILNRHFYKKNILGLTPTIIEKAEKWHDDYKGNITILLSTHDRKLTEAMPADTSFYIDEKTNIASFSQFLMNAKSQYFVFAWQGGIIDDNIKELLYSFYPKIVGQNVENNSGIVLLEKDDASFNYAFFENFEKQGVDNWTQDEKRIKVDSVTGNHSYFFGSSDEWGPAIEIPVDDKILQLKKLAIISDVLMNEKPEEALLVFTTERSGVTDIYQTIDISEFVIKPEEWGRVAFTVNLESKIKEGDRLKIYFWNRDKQSFQIDNLKLKYVYSDSE